MRMEAGLVLALTVVLTGDVAEVRAADDLTLVVYLENYAAPPASLEVAVPIVERIFADAGLGVTWVTGSRALLAGSQSRRPHEVSVVISNHDSRCLDAAPPDTELGKTAARIGRAVVYLNCVARAADLGAFDHRVLLARVVAHEIGHVLLGEGQGHTTRGIMRPTLDLRMEGRHTFLADQAKRMRRELKRGSELISESAMRRN